MHFHFASPRYLLVSYGKSWTRYYSENGFVLKDPTVLWALRSEGTTRWSDLAENDSAGVLRTAKEFGLAYGLATSVHAHGRKSLGGFAREDREFTEAEAENMLALFGELHTATVDVQDFSEEVSLSLQEMSVQLTHAF